MKIDKQAKGQYKYITDCHCCDTQDIHCLQTNIIGIPRHGQKQKYYFCKVCANSFIANAFLYPETRSNADVIKAIGWITNQLLKEIRDLKQQIYNEQRNNKTK